MAKPIAPEKIAPRKIVAFIALIPPVEVRGSLEHWGGAEQSARAIASERVAVRPQVPSFAPAGTRNPLTRSGRHGNVKASGLRHAGAAARIS
jgi:hypothetical protein